MGTGSTAAGVGSAAAGAGSDSSLFEPTCPVWRWCLRRPIPCLKVSPHSAQICFFLFLAATTASSSHDEREPVDSSRFSQSYLYDGVPSAMRVVFGLMLYSPYRSLTKDDSHCSFQEKPSSVSVLRGKEVSRSRFKLPWFGKWEPCLLLHELLC